MGLGVGSGSGWNGAGLKGGYALVSPELFLEM